MLLVIGVSYAFGLKYGQYMENQMINIVICDDEIVILRQLRDYVASVFLQLKAEYDIKTFSRPVELLEALESKKIDILLLDIDMPGISGMEIASELRKYKKQVILIFVTCQESLVYESFQYQPFDFIRKSCYERDLRITLQRAMKLLDSQKQEYLIESAETLIRLRISDILYFEACANNIKIVTKENTYQQRKTMHQLQEELNCLGFIRIHKGYLVNQKAIRILKADRVILENQVELPIGRHYSIVARKEILGYLRG